MSHIETVKHRLTEPRRERLRVLSAVTKTVDRLYHLRPYATKGDVTLDDSQRRFSSATQRCILTLLRHCFKWLQHCSNIATRCCAKIVVANRPV